MYSKKNVGPRMEPWELNYKLDTLEKTFHPEPTKAVYLWEKMK